MAQLTVRSRPAYLKVHRPDTSKEWSLATFLHIFGSSPLRLALPPLQYHGDRTVSDRPSPRRQHSGRRRHRRHGAGHAVPAGAVLGTAFSRPGRASMRSPGSTRRPAFCAALRFQGSAHVAIHRLGSGSPVSVRPPAIPPAGMAGVSRSRRPAHRAPPVGAARLKTNT